MDNNGGLEFIYIILTILFSVVGAIKSWKKQRETPVNPPVSPLEPDEEPPFPEVLEQWLEKPTATGSTSATGQGEAIAASHEEARAAAMERPTTTRASREQRFATLFQAESGESVETTEESLHMDWREAIVANEILKRKF